MPSQLRNTLILTSLLLCSVAVAAATSDKPVSVTVAPLSSLQMLTDYRTAATVVSSNQALLSAQISARIDAIDVNVGDTVKRGDPLVRFDCRAPKLASDDAQARLSLAQSEAKRARSLRQSSNIAEQNYNQAQTELSRAETAYAQTQLQISHCRLNAPFDGVITQRQASLGELASPGTPLLTLLDQQQLELEVNALPEVIATLQSATQPEFISIGKRYPVEIRTVVPVIDSSSGNQTVRLRFTDRRPAAGSHGELQWQSLQPSLPPRYLLKRDDQAGVFIADQGQARFVAIEGNDISQPAVVDLPAETLIVDQGRYGLIEGQPIEVRSQQ